MHDNGGPTENTTQSGRFATVGRYQILRKLGEGAMATVYLAQFQGEDGFRKLVALKIVRSEVCQQPDFVKWFKTEARLGGFLNHVNIVSTQAYGHWGNRPFMAMDYVNGPSLQRLLNVHRKRGLTIPFEIALLIVIEICRGLFYAHRAQDPDGNPLNMVHRDLKPSNILLTMDGAVKIADFGIARSTASELNTEASGIIKGTLRYLSPEQARGQRELDGRSDLFAVGLVAYELLTLNPLYDHPNAYEVIRAAGDAHVSERLQALPVDLPARDMVISALKKALAYDPINRFQSGYKMAEKMAELLPLRQHQIGLLKWLESLFPLLNEAPGDIAAVSNESEPKPGEEISLNELSLQEKMVDRRPIARQTVRDYDPMPQGIPNVSDRRPGAPCMAQQTFPDVTGPGSEWAPAAPNQIEAAGAGSSYQPDQASSASARWSNQSREGDPQQGYATGPGAHPREFYAQQAHSPVEPTETISDDGERNLGTTAPETPEMEPTVDFREQDWEGGSWPNRSRVAPLPDYAPLDSTETMAPGEVEFQGQAFDNEVTCVSEKGAFGLVPPGEPDPVWGRPSHVEASSAENKSEAAQGVPGSQGAAEYTPLVDQWRSPGASSGAEASGGSEVAGTYETQGMPGMSGAAGRPDTKGMSVAREKRMPAEDTSSECVHRQPAGVAAAPRGEEVPATLVKKASIPEMRVQQRNHTLRFRRLLPMVRVWGSLVGALVVFVVALGFLIFPSLRILGVPDGSAWSLDEGKLRPSNEPVVYNCLVSHSLTISHPDYIPKTVNLEPFQCLNTLSVPLKPLSQGAAGAR